MTPDQWIEVDLSALRHNVGEVLKIIGTDVKLMAVVKGNGYGHGLVEPAKAFLDAGATSLAVTHISEAVALRTRGITAPILILAPILEENAASAVRFDLTCTVDSIVLAQALDKAAETQKKVAEIHLKVDTGMGRLGVAAHDAPALVQSLLELKNLKLAGVFTHFARATDEDQSYTAAQLSTFKGVQGVLKPLVPEAVFHTANSAAAIRLPESRFDLVRCGTVLYGQAPFKNELKLKATWLLKAKILAIHELPGGARVGYGAEYVTSRASRLAVLGIGTADGFAMAPEGALYRQSVLQFLARKKTRTPTVLFECGKANVVGRVSMQLASVDITGLNSLKVGDIAIVPCLRLAADSAIPRVYIN